MPAMPRGLDHIVHAVRDLDTAADLYRRLGFTVGARNRHPWGTHNHIVQFPGFFIELLTFAEPDKLGNDGFSILFGAYNRDFIQRGEGLSVLILESEDARADEDEFRAAGVLAMPTMRFDREGKRPDGVTVKVGFSLTFAEDKAAPNIHFTTCQQHYPENFWNPAFQRHANSAVGIAGVVAVAERPEHHARFFEVFAGGPSTAVGDGFTIETPRGTIDMLTPAAFTQRFGVRPPNVSGGPHLAALRFTVNDMSLLEALPEQAGIAGMSPGNPTVVGPADAMGAVLVFGLAVGEAR
jgi:catechol 2,3-dioxygenase-like lactoylglutathione lyase family enzyme